MDRRAFLRTVGTGSTAAAVTSTESLASSAQHSDQLPPQATSGPVNRGRLGIASTLLEWQPKLGEWNTTTVNYLYRRAGFGATLAEVAAAKAIQPGKVIDALLDDNLLANVDSPKFSDQWLNKAPYIGVDYQKQVEQQNSYYTANMEIRRHWTEILSKPDTMLRERLVLFWMNHFVVESIKVYYPQSMYNLIDYFRHNAWGNFKEMVKDVTIAPAMLIYLDGVLNQGMAPNENYARELLELFTMGINFKDQVDETDPEKFANYSQNDLEGIAHVLTGWTVDSTAVEPNVLPAAYNVARHDSSFQKIFDNVNRQYNLTASGASMDKDIIDHIFDMRGDAIAWFMCKKFYQFFIYHEPTTKAELDIIDQLAATFKQNWSIKAVISQLLKSEHFFDPVNIGAQLKSPYDHVIGMVRQFDLPLDRLQAGSLYYYTIAQSQQLLDPPNVKGWPGHHSWMSTTTLPLRGVMGTLLAVSGAMPAYGADGYGTTHTPIMLTDAQVLSWGKQFENYNGDFDDLLAEMAAFLCPQPIGPNAHSFVKSKFSPNVYEWQKLSDTEKITALRLMASSIMQLAEYQLA